MRHPTSPRSIAIRVPALSLALALALALGVPAPAFAFGPTHPVSTAVVPQQSTVERGSYLGATPIMNGWARTAAVRRAIVSKYQTSSATPMYAAARSRKQVARIPADYTLGTRTNASSNGRVQVEYAGKTGWIKSSAAAKVAGNTRIGKLSWKDSAAKNIAKWCRGVPITAGPNRPNEAEASGWIGNMKEKISLDTNGFNGKTIDPNHPLALSLQYHECAHILQYRAYKYDFARMDKAMNKAYGKPRTAAGTEHMADCMAVAMGARLKGSEHDPRTGYTTTWYSGYGGACKSRHLDAARKIIAGKRL